MEVIFFKSDTIGPVKFCTTPAGKIDFRALGRSFRLEPGSIILCGARFPETDLESKATWTQIKNVLGVAGTREDPMVVSGCPILEVPTGAKTFYEVLGEGFEDDTYLPSFERKGKSKTIPKDGGKTPDTFDLWESFEAEVLHFIRKSQESLKAEIYPRILPHGLEMEISNEAEVRSAIHWDCTRAVELALQTCLGESFTIKSADDRFVRGNMDFAGFVLNLETKRPESVVLPIEIKGPWQLDVEPWESLVDLMNGDDSCKNRVKNAIAQIFMYMVLSETMYGVLCSKSRYYFFRRLGDPEEKQLEVSRAVCNDSANPTARQSFLYISHLSIHAELFPSVMVDVTPPECKWVTIPSRRLHNLGSPSRSVGRRNATGTSVGSQVGQGYRGGQHGGQRGAQHGGHRGGYEHEVDWFLSLPDLCLSSLELGKILHRSPSSMIFSHKSKENFVFKVYEFSETFETLSQFKREVDAYTHLADLHGILVPRIYGYGASWGHFLGFIAMEALGESLEEAQMEQHLVGKLMDGLNLLHRKEVLHGDLHLENIVFASQEDEGCTSALNFGFRFIDFGESICRCDKVWLQKEEEQFQCTLGV